MTFEESDRCFAAKRAIDRRAELLSDEFRRKLRCAHELGLLRLLLEPSPSGAPSPLPGGTLSGLPTWASLALASGSLGQS